MNFNMTDYLSANSGDFNRKNLVSVFFSAGPGNRAMSYLGSAVTDMLSGTPIAQMMSDLAIDIDGLGKIGDSWLNQQLSRWGSTEGNQVLAVLNNRVVDSFLGEISVGNEVLRYFQSIPTQEYTLRSIKLPPSSYTHNYIYGNAPGAAHEIGRRNLGYVTVTFNYSAARDNYAVWKSYVDMIKSQDTNLQHFADDMVCNMTVVEHARNGMPTKVHSISGAIAHDVSEMTYDYESNNEIQTFDVTFAYITHHVGGTPEDALKEWAENIVAASAGMLGASVDGLIGSTRGVPSRRGGLASTSSVTRLLGPK